MRSSSFSYLVKEGVRNICANTLMSLASVGVLVACMSLIGASMLFSININRMVGYVEDQNEVVAFLNDDIQDDALPGIEQQLGSIDNIIDYKYISREEGLKQLMESLEQGEELLSILQNDNPLPDSYHLRIDDLNKLSETLSKVKEIPGVAKIQAPEEVARVISSLKKIVNIGGTMVISILVAVSIVVISNTIRITIFTRRREINIMKFVGATNGFITLPFIVEGIVLGLVSATISLVLLWGGLSAAD